MNTFRTLCVLLVLAVFAAPVSGAQRKLLGEGEGTFRPIDLGGLPDFSFTQPLTGEERAYLGLKGEGPFTLRDVDADLVLLEFINVYCYACVMQAPIMNIVHSRVEAREDLRDRVRFLAVAVGNGEKETSRFKGQFEIAYPLLPDEAFGSLDAVGNPGGTPFTVLYPRGGGGAGPLAHLGVMADADRFVEEIEASLAGEPAGAGEKPTFELTTWRNLDPDLSPEALRERILAAAAAAGFEAVKAEPVEAAGERNLFRLADGAGGILWAKVAGRAKVCNVCHDIFFILLFDSSGKIVNFEPIHVTKYENVPIDESEAAFMRERVVGRSLKEPVLFDAEVDAITQATMSSELIFDTMRRLAPVFEGLDAGR